MISFSRPPVHWLEDIPSFVDGDKNIDHATVEAFGDEWTRFDSFSDQEIDTVAAEYFDILPAEKLREFKHAIDVGCGSGRWTRFIAKQVSSVEAVDPSEACLVARRNTADLANVRVSQASVNALPFADEAFDLAICLGVLHHVPNTQEALTSLCKKISFGGTLLLYLYYDLSNRSMPYRLLHRASEIPRKIVAHLPHKLKNLSCDLLAFCVYLPLIGMAKLTTAVSPNLGPRMPLSYYTNKSWNIIRNDARDRFGTPLEQRFSQIEIENMLHTAGMSNVRFSNNAPFWHCTAIKS
ncbi:MAG: methyltransferase domain-containing protein [Cryomorphaceae bacterium]|nr:methyltransferase domain-containing protein [Cryomorphaceae bacterium]